MEIRDLEEIFETRSPLKDGMDTPDCFGEFDKKKKLCNAHCPIAIRCCVMQTHHPKIDILEKLLIHNTFAERPN